MYNKIYKTMCAVTLTSLIVSTLFIVMASFTLFLNHLAENAKNDAIIAASALDLQGFSEDEYENFHSRNFDIYTHEGISVITGEKNNAVCPLETDGFIGGKSAYAVFLDNGYILTKSIDMYKYCYILFVTVALAVFVLVVIYIITRWFASALTKNILSPLKDIYSYEQDCIYEELEPFIKRLSMQSELIKRQQRKVNEQKTRLQAISENMNEGLIVVDTNKSILLVNKGILSVFNTTEDTVKYNDFSKLTEDEELNKHLDTALLGKKDYLEFKTDKNSYQVFYSPVFEKEQVRGVVILFIDASEKLKTEQIRREFSANVSHELKTPLTTIHGYAQLITNGIAKKDDISGFSAKIEKESLRMITLIDDIIKLSRLDEHQNSPEKENIDLIVLANDVVEKLAEKAKSKNISIALIPENTIIYANKMQITEILYNLLDNAIKYNHDNGNVKITITENGFSVSDTGIGIPEKYLDRIYERFFRADKSHSKKIGGTGLGLSIAKHMANSNNATIDVQSKEGEGTTFTVTFKK